MGSVARAGSALINLYMAIVAALAAVHYWRARSRAKPLPTSIGTFMFANMVLFAAFMAAAVAAVLFFPGALADGAALLRD